MRRITIAILLLALSANSSSAPAAEWAGSQQRIVLIAGRMIDGAGATRTNVRITVQGSKILSVEAAAGAMPAGAIDLRGLTVLPGLIDLHDHIGWHFDTAGRYASGRGAAETPEQRTKAMLENARVTLFAGFTTILSPGQAVDTMIRGSIVRGVVAGPRIVTSLSQLQPGNRSPDSLRAQVRRLKEQGADLIKTFASASIRDGGTMNVAQAQLDAICAEGKAIGIRTMVHAHSIESVRAAALAGCTQIEHGVFATQAEMTLMAEKGTYFDPQCGLVFHNYLDNRAKFDGIGNYNAEGFAAMEKAIPLATETYRLAVKTPGLKVVFGTDAVAGAHGRNAEDLVCRVSEAGDTPMNAIIAATSLAAESMGMQNSIGTIKPGLEADIIAVEGDPIGDITALRRVKFVMRAGVAYKNEVRRAP